MNLYRSIAISVTILFPAISAIATETEQSAPLTKLEARQLPPPKLARRVLDQLFEILELPNDTANPWHNPARPKHPLSDLFYATRSHGSDIPDLCVSSLITLHFNVAGTRDVGAATPVGVSGVSAHDAYRFLAPPANVEVPYNSLGDRQTLDRRCGALDPLKMAFFTAHDEDDALRGAQILDAAIKAAGTGGDPALFECSWKPKCAQTVASEDLGKLEDVELCHAGETDEAADCMSFWTEDDFLLIVHFKFDGGTYSIVHVKVDELVTIGDERED